MLADCEFIAWNETPDPAGPLKAPEPSSSSSQPEPSDSAPAAEPPLELPNSTALRIPDGPLAAVVVLEPCSEPALRALMEKVHKERAPRGGEPFAVMAYGRAADLQRPMAIFLVNAAEPIFIYNPEGLDLAEFSQGPTSFPGLAELWPSGERGPRGSGYSRSAATDLGDTTAGPSGTSAEAAPPAAPASTALSGLWRTESGAEFRLTGEASALKIEYSSERGPVQSIEGSLPAAEPNAYRGQLTAVYRASPGRKWNVRGEAVSVDASTVRLSLEDAPTWHSVTGNFTGRRKQETMFQRAED